MPWSFSFLPSLCPVFHTRLLRPLLSKRCQLPPLCQWFPLPKPRKPHSYIPGLDFQVPSSHLHQMSQAQCVTPWPAAFSLGCELLKAPAISPRWGLVSDSVLLAQPFIGPQIWSILPFKYFSFFFSPA